MRSAVLLITVLMGCNQVFSLEDTQLVDADTRPDLDKDGIADVEDPCIAPPGDADADFDGDGIPNGVDPCPIFTGNSDIDSDGDGVGDGCDAFRTMPGDAHRCSMAFTSRELNATLWTARPGETEIAIASNLLLSFGDGSAIAVERVLPTTKTIVVDALVQIAFNNAPFSFGYWLSAGEAPSANDVTCGAFGNALGVVAAMAGPTQVTSPQGPPAGSDSGFLVRTILEPDQTGTNVQCTVVYGGGILTTQTHVNAPFGSFGLVSKAGANGFQFLNITSRDDTPALPVTF